MVEYMNPPKHDSFRGEFAYSLYQEMKTDRDIILLTADLGYGMLDHIKKDFSDRYINVGASEMAMLGIACGLALEGKKPFCYSISSFLIYRPYEIIRTYVDHENIPVRLVGGGRDMDYSHDGFSHHSNDLRPVMDRFINIQQYWPYAQVEVGDMVKSMVEKQEPAFLSLPR